MYWEYLLELRLALRDGPEVAEQELLDLPRVVPQKVVLLAALLDEHHLLDYLRALEVGVLELVAREQQFRAEARDGAQARVQLRLGLVDLAEDGHLVELAVLGVQHDALELGRDFVALLLEDAVDYVDRLRVLRLVGEPALKILQQLRRLLQLLYLHLLKTADALQHHEAALQRSERQLVLALDLLALFQQDHVLLQLLP